MKITRTGGSIAVTVDASCASCQYLDMTDTTQPKTTPGKCRRRMLASGAWGEVNPSTDWCGEYEQKPS